MKTIDYIKSNELKTSEEWQTIYPETKVLDADGWDRLNFQFSWFEEKINHIEYCRRLFTSTIEHKIK